MKINWTLGFICGISTLVTFSVMLLATLRVYSTASAHVLDFLILQHKLFAMGGLASLFSGFLVGLFLGRGED